MGIRVEPIVTVFDCEWFITPLLTPNRIFVYFWEIEQCPGKLLPPNMHVFSLYQDEIHHCEWHNEPSSFGWTIHLFVQAPPLKVLLNMTHTGGGLFFNSEVTSPAMEHDVFNNMNIICGGANFAIKGNATIFWMSAALDLINDMNLPNDGNTFMEFFIAEGNVPVYKFCNVKYSLNQKYLISP